MINTSNNLMALMTRSCTWTSFWHNNVAQYHDKQHHLHSTQMINNTTYTYFCKLSKQNDNTDEISLAKDWTIQKTHTRLMIDMASMLRCRGYRTSSLTMLSNTSSSSSPGNGDYTQQFTELNPTTVMQETIALWSLKLCLKITYL